MKQKFKADRGNLHIKSKSHFLPTKLFRKHELMKMIYISLVLKRKTEIEASTLELIELIIEEPEFLNSVLKDYR